MSSIIVSCLCAQYAHLSGATLAASVFKCLLCGIFMVNVPTWKNQYGRVTLESGSELFCTFYTKINSLILNG